jgi:maltose O-acetyltransferase
MTSKTEKEKMAAGEPYLSADPVLVQDRKEAKRLCRLFNVSTEDEMEKRKQLLPQLLGSCPADIYIEPPFRCDYGYNFHVGEGFYANYDLIVLDVCPIRIGKNCFIAPRVSLFTATHPLDAETRNSGVEYGKPITLGDNVWIGGHCVINPGVTLGNNVVVAAGSVVANSFGDNVVIGGVPAKILKHLK